MTATPVRPLELPDRVWASTLADILHFLDDTYGMTSVHVSNPGHPQLAWVTVLCDDLRDAQDLASEFHARYSRPTAQGRLGLEWTRKGDYATDGQGSVDLHITWTGRTR